MDNETLLAQVTDKAQLWLSGNYDEETKKEVRQMLQNEDKRQLIDAFYKDLEFGTGGLRGIMGAGSNRMNIYTVGAATQGLSNYLLQEFADLEQIKVVIGPPTELKYFFSRTYARHRKFHTPFANSAVRVGLCLLHRTIPKSTTDIRPIGKTAHKCSGLTTKILLLK
jgi:hypothetical protein